MTPGTAGRGRGVRNAFPRPPEQAGATIPSFPQRSQLGWGQPQSQPCLGQWQQSRATCTGSSSRSPPQCTQGLLRHLLPPHWAEVGTNSSVTATLAQQPAQQRHKEQQLSLKHRHGHSPGPEMNMGPPAPTALPLCTARAQGRAGVAVPGWGQLCVLTAPVPLHVSHWPPSLPRALPALTCLVVVIDLHLGWLQAPHGDVPLHREGEAEGLPAQLGKGSSRGSGGLCTAGAPLCLGTAPGLLRCPRPPMLWGDTVGL